MDSLKPEDHGLLNYISLHFSRDVRQKIFAEKRLEYTNDPKAQLQIDSYDPDTAVGSKIAEYKNALSSRNQMQQMMIEKWMSENHADFIKILERAKFYFELHQRNTRLPSYKAE